MGATENPGPDLSFKAENDLSSKQFYAVELSGDDQVDICDGAGDLVIGILQNKPTAGHAATVRVYGRTKWVASTTITRGARVGTTNAGKCVAKAAAADLCAGIALEAATADGDVISVLLTPGCERSTT